MAELEQEVREIVAKVIRRPAASIDPNVNIFTEYQVDSLLGVEILANLDKKFGIDVPEDKIRQIKTLTDITNVVKEYLQKK